jgi:CRISPR-associated endonuclease Cas2
MAGGCEFTVICFDIADDCRRRQVVRVLEAWGVRAQESVFEAWLDDRQRRTMMTRLASEIAAGDDRVVAYVLSEADHADIVSLGQGLPAEDFAGAII